MAVIAVTKAESESTIRIVDEETVKIQEYIGHLRPLRRGPQVFTATNPAGSVIRPHFHAVDQCQVFVEGSATVASHAAEPVMLHYADAYTAYGPIKIDASDDLTFFNLRARHDPGAQYMPGSRKHMAIRGGREILAKASLSLDDSTKTLRMETLIDLQDDGLAAYEMAARPGAHFPDVTALGQGCFELVLDGSIMLDEKELPKHSVVYAEAGERFGQRVAGSDGARVLEVHFPLQ